MPDINTLEAGIEPNSSKISSAPGDPPARFNHGRSAALRCVSYRAIAPNPTTLDTTLSFG